MSKHKSKIGKQDTADKYKDVAVLTDVNFTLKTADTQIIRTKVVCGDSINDAMIETEDLVMPGKVLPMTPRYIFGRNCTDPEGKEVCIPIKQTMHPAILVDNNPTLVVRPAQIMNLQLTTRAFCQHCKDTHDMHGFALEVPHWWDYNAVLQCENCLIIFFLNLVKAEDDINA